MKYYKLIVAVIFLFLFCGHLYAQENLWYKKNLAAYTNYVSTQFGISINVPEKFVDLDKYYVGRQIRVNHSVAWLGGPIFQTIDKECILMYQARPIYVTEKEKEIAKTTILINRRLNGDVSSIEPKIGTSRMTRGQITAEVKAATGLYDNAGKPLKDSVHFNFNDHVTIIAGKKPREMFNADTMYIYELPLQKSYSKKYIISGNLGNVAMTDSFHLGLQKTNRKKYIYRTGLVLAKENRASMFFMLFFTLKGKKNEWKYISMLGKDIWYEGNFKRKKK